MKSFKEYYKDPMFRKKVLDYKNEKIECECGAITSRVNRYRHLKGKIHVNNMNRLEYCKCGEKIKRSQHADHCC
ncbi:hypothetical protein DFA_00300 [Cavenderia fasciculata]|uniref:Uncharacterized protein n=1 Tax=Cavenderia fasciculata TaxID=261658 RepID=F4PY62_CACFS|nr:uncharacterized protein DFA_00300 [Cavenderia fasciculata]EGG19722.1 hypothetical protein DFA_00300 [Cavenderia fasciculata]|eukprot:XP_004358016.1 hypothetical protein DFA_00300 [Cavenderia fasciculata]